MRHTWIGDCGRSGVFGMLGDQVACYQSGSGSVFSSGQPPTDSLGTHLHFSTGATGGNYIGFLGASIYRTGRNIAFASSVALNQTTGFRAWLGMTDQSVFYMANSDNPDGNRACFLASPNIGSGFFVCAVKDGTNQQTAVTNVSVETSPHLFQIAFDDSAETITFLIDGQQVASFNSGLPAHGINLHYCEAMGLTGTSSCAFDCEYVTVDVDR